MNKPTLILLPALLTDQRLYNNQLQCLQKNCNVITPVLKDYDDINSACEYILKLAPEKFIVVGTSMGGYIAMHMAAHFPSRLTKICLIGTKVDLDSTEARQQRIKTIDTTLASKQVVATLSRIKELIYNVTPKNIQLIQDMNLSLGWKTFINHQRLILSRENIKNKLNNCTVPTLVIVGENDVITPVSCSEEIVRSFSNSSLVKLPKTGHLVSLDKPDVLSALIEDFIN